MGSILNFLPIIICVNLISACASPLKLDTTLIRPYTEADEKKEPFAAPYVSIYSDGTKKLIFVAAEHLNGINNATAKTIQKAFIEHKPKFMIVEGRAYTSVSNPKDVDYVQRCITKNYTECGEDAWALNLAITDKIPFSYGEPADITVLQELKKLDYTDKELILFYGLRQIPQWKREGAGKNSQLEKKLKEALPRFTQRLQSNTNFDLIEFKNLYREKFQRDLKYKDIDTETVSPRTDNNPEWGNRISHHVGIVRENFLVEQIEKRLNEFDTVMVVYGGGHLVKQRGALQEALGSPKDIKLY